MNKKFEDGIHYEGYIMVKEFGHVLIIDASTGEEVCTCDTYSEGFHEIDSFKNEEIFE